MTSYGHMAILDMSFDPSKVLFTDKTDWIYIWIGRLFIFIEEKLQIRRLFLFQSSFGVKNLTGSAFVNT